MCNSIKIREVKIMKFVKGVLIGTAIAAGVAMMYNEGMVDKRRIMRKGRQVARKIWAF